ncbi:MAG TPA: TolC family protein [Pirellulales bacterium]|nr:TolC family protein [Pirellulales bacterium]
MPRVVPAPSEMIPPGTPNRAPRQAATSFPRVAPPGRGANNVESLPIDLPTALRLANADNLQVALAREQIRQALARVERAQTLWLPSIRGGTSYNRHDGSIQNVDGTQFNTSRGAFYSGLGAGVYGAGTPIVPGVYANFSLADAIFQPLAARQFAAGRQRAAAAATNDAILNVSLGYLELLRAHQDLSISLDIREKAQRLADVTADYARTGEGLQSDADRLQTELAVRRNDLLRAEESRKVASARLAQLLHIDPTMLLEPVEPTVVPIELVPEGADLRELVIQGLSRRPELDESRFLVGEAVQRLRRERFAPLVPSLLVGGSYGAMGAGVNGNLAPGTGRLDLDAAAYWEMRNLGLGDAAARHDAQSAVRQAQVRQLAAMDLVSREITEAHAQVEARRRQIAIGREGVEAAANSYQRNLDRVLDARGLPLEALQSIQALAQARREYLRTLVDYDAAQFTLYRAIGTPSGDPSQTKPATPSG